MSFFEHKDTLSFTRRHRPDFRVLIYMSLLMLLGLVIIYAIGPQRANVLNNAYGSNYSDTYFFIKQLTSLALSLGMFILLAFLPYRWVIKFSDKLVIISFILCAILAIASFANIGIAQNSLGATRWFDLGPFGSMQPSEMLKFSVLVFFAGFLGNRVKNKEINSLKNTLIPVAVITIISLIFIVIIQKDLGTGISLVGIIMTMLYIGGLNKLNIFSVVGILAILGTIFIISAPHRIERILTYLKGDSTSEVISSQDSSYHIEHAKLAIGTGGLFGVGIGNSIQATGYLPEAINDSVFAIMGETFGFVGLIVIIILFASLLTRLLKIMDHLPDANLKLLAAGVFGWLGSHVILNIASMLGVFPLTGITLPLLSFGGTSMLFISAALGLVFQISHYTVHSSKLKEAQDEDSSSRRRIGRTRYTRRSSSTRN